MWLLWILVLDFGCGCHYGIRSYGIRTFGAFHFWDIGNFENWNWESMTSSIINGSWVKAQLQGSWLMAHGQEKCDARTRGLGELRPILYWPWPSLEQRALRHEPWATSQEPLPWLEVFIRVLIMGIKYQVTLLSKNCDCHPCISRLLRGHEYLWNFLESHLVMCVRIHDNPLHIGRSAW